MLLIYTNKYLPRAEYIISTLLSALAIKSFSIIQDKNVYLLHNGPRINYSSSQIAENEYWIQPVNLLFEENIIKQHLEIFTSAQHPAFFKTNGHFAFDIFAASFYLISRYEEYLPHQLDMYGRYAHENSLAFNHNFLHLPLVNIWLKNLKEDLLKIFPGIETNKTNFRYLPTYDIDIAYSYLHKGMKRNAGGLIKSLLKINGNEFIERIKTLFFLQKDPFDIYNWLDEMHKQYRLQPIYFFLLAQQSIGYDKNIDPTKKPMQQLIKQQADKYQVGIHPSWQSGDDNKNLMQEINLLKLITGKQINKSRQHYIRITLPATYHNLMAAGITEDYSMGYGSINGFRASYCLPFKWFDLINNKNTSLTIFPFCYMEANALFEQKLSPKQAFEELRQYYKIIKELDGLLITIFHNHLITAQPRLLAWRNMYADFLRQVIPS